MYVPTAKTSFFADLHTHSKYARATSKLSDLEHLAYWGAKKGISVVGTGDFTHPAWRGELRDKLVPAEPGLFRLREDIEREVRARLDVPVRGLPRFLLSVEISTIYKKGDKTRKVHHLIYAPDFDSVDRMVESLAKIGNLRADGRPILGLDSRHLLEIALSAGEGCYLVPAHVWTPWFAVLGSKSGFDAVADCYGDLAEHIFAVETGLSSDPPMNWCLSSLDRYTLVSNSDAHSPPKLGREANVFTCDMDYFAMRRALETREGFAGTVEFFPEEGKYHLDGHRKCEVVLDPAETKALEGRCPSCGKPLTVGVMHRVQDLADRPLGYRPADAPDFRSFVPLSEIVAEIVGAGVNTKTVGRAYESLLARLGSELFILEHAPIEDLRRGGHGQLGSRLAEAVTRMREGRVIRQAGYDGEYGVIRLFEARELRRPAAVSLALALPEPPAAEASAPAPEPVPASPASVASAPGTAAEFDPPPSEIPRPSPETPRDGAASSLLSALDPEQRRAAECVHGPLLIVAGPGTGKTRTLTHRIAHLVEDIGVEPAACLAITFTNRAAGELRERLDALLPGAGAGVAVHTFHSLALRILRENRVRAGLHRGFRVAAESECVALLAEALGCLPAKARSVLARLRRASVAASVAAGAGQGAAEQPPEASAESLDDELARAHRVYRQALEEAARLDFDELLGRAEALLREDDIGLAYRARFRHLSIDEYQDIDAQQYRLIALLSGDVGAAGMRDGGQDETGGSRSLCAIGDPDQAIYGFRGADVGFFLRFREEYPRTREVQLTRNYRSTATIVDAALQAIAPHSLVAERVLEAADAGEGAASLPVHVVSAASARAEAETVVHSIEALIGGTSFFSMDSGRLDDIGVGVGAAPGERGAAPTENDESDDLSFSDFAILYRTDAQSGLLCEALARSGIPFQKRSHHRLGDDPLTVALLGEMRDATAAAAAEDAESPPPGALQAFLDAASIRLRARLETAVAAGPTPDATAAEATTSAVTGDPALDPARIAAVADLLRPLAARCDDLDSFANELALEAEVDLWDARADRVSLLTLHAAKGLEFRVVFLVGCEDGVLPLRWGSGRAEDLGEERRLFFVGMTRARQRLYLLHARKRRWRGELCELPVSPFVRDIEDQLLARGSSRPRKKPVVLHEQLGLF